MRIRRFSVLGVVAGLLTWPVQFLVQEPGIRTLMPPAPAAARAPVGPLP